MEYKIMLTMPLADGNGETNLDTGIKCSFFPHAFLIGISILGFGIYFAVRDK